MKIHRDKKKEPLPYNIQIMMIPREDIREKYSGIQLVEPKPKPNCTCNDSYMSPIAHISGSVIITNTPTSNNILPNRVYCKYPHYKMDYIK